MTTITARMVEVPYTTRRDSLGGKRGCGHVERRLFQAGSHGREGRPHHQSERRVNELDNVTIVAAMTVLARLRAVAVASAVIVVLVGCDHGSASPATTTTGNAAMCAALDDLQSSMKALTSVDFINRTATDTGLSLASGKSELQTAVSNVNDDLQAFKAAASSQLQPQVKAFQDSLDELGSAISNVRTVGVGRVITADSNAIEEGSKLTTALSHVRCR
jgi:hypothetical protein